MFRSVFCHSCWNGNDELLYCTWCIGCKHCFGCSGMRNAEYCILNKQYSKQEYEILVPKLIEHMRSTGEWGSFFPKKNSIFGYNETAAADFFPLKEEEARRQGWHWQEDEGGGGNYLGPDYQVPERISDVEDSITGTILRCERTGKPYKIIPQELRLYRELRLPIPRKCPDARHGDRVILRNPRKLWARKCAKCSAEIQTTYAPDRPEIVYCERCYLETVY